MRARDLLLDAWADLVLGSACVGCARAGRPLCRSCATRLDQVGHRTWPVPTPDGLVPTYSTGEYADLLRATVLAYKERQVHSLGAPLARVLVRAIDAALEDTAGDDPVVLVPVPSRPAAVRERGYEPTTVLARRAARILRGYGRPVYAARLLRSDGAVLDQAGLDAPARARNLAGSMNCPGHLLHHLPVPRAHVVVCDDVVTTGATLREAQRALEIAGVGVHAAAVLAATRRRSSGMSAGLYSRRDTD